ncbi:MAG: ABC transporter substrate-binding protein [Candidatus Bathyarchaeia archaeon]
MRKLENGRRRDMKKASLFALVATAALLIPVFAPVFATGPPQPENYDPTTIYEGTIAWGPRRADPVRAYDTASGELLFNVYDTLIEMGGDVVNPLYPGIVWDVEEQYWEFRPRLAVNVPNRQEIIATFMSDTVPIPADPTGIYLNNSAFEIVGWVDNNPDGVFGPVDVIYVRGVEGGNTKIRTWQTISVDANIGKIVAHRFYYDFRLRTDPAIFFYDKDGNVVGQFDIGDVLYSFRRGLVQDQYGSPMWMFYKPFFDQMNSDFWDTGNPEDALELSFLIDSAIEIVSTDPDPPIVRFNLGITFPDAAFKQIMSQTWASILDKDWCMGKGCWDDELFSDDGRYTGSVAENGIPDWFESWRHCIAFGYVSPIQSIKPENYAGTGPYRVVVASAAQNLVVLQRNPNYWRGWPAPFYTVQSTGELVRLPGYLEYVDIEYIADWTTRKTAFLACQLDVCAVPRANMMELLDPNDPARMITIDPAIITIKNISPVLAMDAVFFTFTISPESPAIYSGRFPDGIPTDFFNNTHTRRAFAYAFDHGKYIHDVWMDEGICRETPLIYGLVPDYYTKKPDPPWTYNYDLEKIKTELQQAMFTQDGETKSVWDWGGFKMIIYYNSGNDPRRLACEYIKAAFDAINSQYGKSFIIEVQGPDWATYLEMLEAYEMPLYLIGWLADFADADNWVRPYMHSYGDFSYYQNYTAWNGWCGTLGPRTHLNKDQLIDIAVKTPDGPQRATYYADLDDIYIADCPSFPIIQTTGRRWQKYWLKGWYYNGLYPSAYFYKQYKAVNPTVPQPSPACWADITGPTVGIPDGVCNMRDIGYISKHFGAKAPDPAATPPYDPRWAPGTYGCGGSDIYGDRKIDMRDIGLASKHFGHTTQP